MTTINEITHLTEEEIESWVLTEEFTMAVLRNPDLVQQVLDHWGIDVGDPYKYNIE